MQMSHMLNHIRRLASREDGFTLIFALGVMLVTSLLIFATFTFTTNDVHLSYANTLQKQAFLAASTGVQEYEHELQVNDDYWETSCAGPEGKVSGEPNESYETSILPANGQSACSTANPFGTIIEKTGASQNTFRIKSVGSAGGKHRTLIATFRVAGFLDFAYFTQYEDEDPFLTKVSGCERYYEEGGSTRSANCGNIEFGMEDSVNGPVHTDDSALVECSKEVTFGRQSQVPKDGVEIDRGTWSPSESKAKGPNESPCASGTQTGASPTSGPTYYTTNGKFSEGAELRAPKSDASVRDYVESGYEFVGRTKIELNGGTMIVENANYHGGAPTTVAWPANGLIFVNTGSKGCGYEYSNNAGSSDTTATYAAESECGSVYVEGEYSKSLTIAAETDVVINGNLTPTGVTTHAGTAPPAAPGTATLGLMATRFVRIYHPCSTSSNKNSTSGPAGGYLSNPFIYAAILSTSHSFLVDNYSCGSLMGELNIYGAIAQKFRGVVALENTSGYVKDYNYDERLATDEPPYFLSPISAGWMIARETAPTGG
jgi:Tfp pilus assembly protein PilX